MVSKAGRGLAIRLLITGGIIAGAVILADRANLGTRIKSGAFQLGQAGGQAITFPIAGLAQGTNEGLAGLIQTSSLLGKTAKELSEGLQKSISATLGGGFNVFSEFGNNERGFNTNVQDPKIGNDVPVNTGGSIFSESNELIKDTFKPFDKPGIKLDLSFLTPGTSFGGKTKITSIPKTSDIEKIPGTKIVNVPTNLTQFARGQTTRIAVPPALQGLFEKIGKA